MTGRSVGELADAVRDGLHCGPPVFGAHEQGVLDMAHDALAELAELVGRAAQAEAAADRLREERDAAIREIDEYRIEADLLHYLLAPEKAVPRAVLDNVVALVNIARAAERATAYLWADNADYDAARLDENMDDLADALAALGKDTA